MPGVKSCARGAFGVTAQLPDGAGELLLLVALAWVGLPGGLALPGAVLAGWVRPLGHGRLTGVS
eukprot:1070930-Lingulodinium_polyedra.AAC.1